MIKYLILFALISTAAYADDIEDNYQAQRQAGEFQEQLNWQAQQLDRMENEIPDSQPQYAAPENAEPGYGATQYVPAIDPNPPVNVVGGQSLGE